MKQSRRLVRLTAITAGVSTLALVLAACDSGGGGRESVNAGGPSVPYGASAEQWQAAFADIDEPLHVAMEFTQQVASHPRAVEFASLLDEAERLSGGKVVFDRTNAYTIGGSVAGWTDALADGRLDFSLVGGYATPSDFPLIGTILNELTTAFPSEQVFGDIVGWAAANEMWYDTPEVEEEFNENGVYGIIPMSTTGRSVLSCAEPVTSLADLAGKQVRAGSVTIFAQLEALGATPVSVPFTETVEAAQRGIIDCAIFGITSYALFPGLLEYQPYIIAPVGTNISIGVGSWAGGANWPDLPLAVQQLIYDAVLMQDIRGILIESHDVSLQVIQNVQAGGGDLLLFDDEVNEKLKEFNETLKETWRNSPLLQDGNAFVDGFEAALEKWSGLIADAGIPQAELNDIDTWSDIDDATWAGVEQVLIDELLIPNRPS